MIDIQKYKTLLENEKEELILTIQKIGGYKDPLNSQNWEVIQTSHNDPADESEIADSIEELETNSGVVDNLEIRLNEINDALKRIENGTYGIDVITGKEIPEERLSINPASTTA